jgi:D-alanyl-D-alanine carboxypeptidase
MRSCRTTLLVAIATTILIACGANTATSPSTAVPSTTATSSLPSTSFPTPTAHATSTTAVSALVADLQAVLDQTVRDNPSIPGMLLHVDAPGHHLDVSLASGLDDRARATLLTPDQGLRIASNTKTFTAAAVLRLVEQHTLNIDDPIGRWLLPETVTVLAAGGYDPDAITVRQLLLHTSGIYDYGKDTAYQAAVVANPAKRWTRLEQVRWAVEHGQPVSAPGSVYSYSDTGYILLGEIIERATGQPLGAAYRTLLGFNRLGLRATYLESLEPTPPATAPRAHQYAGDADGFDLDPSFDLYGAAGLVSTVEDLGAFYRALLHGEVFTTPDTLNTMLTIPPTNLDAHAAMGIFRDDINGQPCWSHSGFWNTYVLSCPDLDLTIAASLDQAFPDPQFDANQVLAKLFALAASG